MGKSQKKQMKWFKHLTASTSDPDLMESESLFKAAGPYVYWRTIEILARENVLKDNFEMDFKAFKLYYPSVSKNKLKQILKFFSQKKRFFLKYNGENISIFCHKLSTISANYKGKVE